MKFHEGMFQTGRNGMDVFPVNKELFPDPPQRIIHICNYETYLLFVQVFCFLYCFVMALMSLIPFIHVSR